MDEQEAKKRTKDLKSFYSHLTSYVIVNAGMMGAFFFGLGSEAVVGPLLVSVCWGGGLAVHAMRVFGIFGLGSSAWEEQKVRELMRNSEKGITKDELAQVLQTALKEASSGQNVPSDRQERILQRLEHLEAIVTSEEWELINGEAEKKLQRIELEEDDEVSVSIGGGRASKKIR